MALIGWSKLSVSEESFRFRLSNGTSKLNKDIQEFKGAPPDVGGFHFDDHTLKSNKELCPLLKGVVVEMKTPYINWSSFELLNVLI